MPKLNNIKPGKRVGALVVQEYSHVKNHNKYWRCRCDCGTELFITTGHLNSENRKSCGCLRIKKLNGRVFGRLTVIEYLYNKNGGAYWRCKCECGSIVDIKSSHLVSGNTKSCGCLRMLNIVGKRFGKLRVVSLNGAIKNKSYFDCVCDCGKKKIICGNKLISGNTQSCGCYSKKLKNKTCLNIYGVEHPMQNKYIALKSARSSKSSCVLKHWKTNEDIVCVASYESAVVNYLNFHKINYKWQHKVFNITLQSGKKTTYRPDLYLVGKKRPWVEIKGYFREDALEKWDIFHNKIKHNSELWDKKYLKGAGII
jgi:hypothetical protein